MAVYMAHKCICFYHPFVEWLKRLMRLLLLRPEKEELAADLLAFLAEFVVMERERWSRAP